MYNDFSVDHNGIMESTGRELPLSTARLHVFDFDDTLVKTGSLVRVTDRSGRRFDLTPGEYSVYVADPGDSFDYSDFDRIIDPREVRKTMRFLRRALAAGSEVVVLTARSAAPPVEQFLKDAGLVGVEVVALGSSDPQKKAEYIRMRIERDGFRHVEFFDDSHRNIAAVEALSPLHPGAKIVVHHVVHRTGLS